jgi:hypothetical protein
MSALTRRRQKDRHQESWQIYYGDVCVGWIGERAGVPKNFERWGWHVGFFPASHRGLRFYGVAETFEEARRAFEKAWRRYLSACTDAHTAWKRRMWDTGCSMPTETVSGVTKCFCGEMINIKTSGDHIRASHMDITA